MAIKVILLVLTLFPLPCFSGNLSRLSWGMENTGKSQQFLIDHYTSGVIEGVAGEDIRPLQKYNSPRSPVMVAVLDTGVDETHPSLEGALVKPGFNAIDGSTNVRDSHGHGTHISGIIAGRSGKSGFQGVSQSALILPIRVIQSGPNAPIRPQDLSRNAGTALTENVARGMVHAIERGARIIHLSLAWPATIRSASVDLAIALAKSRDVLIVASAGNDSTDALVQPCIYSEVICVGAHGPDGAFTHFSNFGPMVDLLAPGISILSTWPTTKAPVTFAGQIGYEFRNGTSMSAPFVTGALAELLSLGHSPREAANRILLSTRPTSLQSRFRADVVGANSRAVDPLVKTSRFGNLDLGAAVQIKESSFIVPDSKAPVTIEWNGRSTTAQFTVAFINRWRDARDVSILENGRIHRFDSVRSNERIEIKIEHPISAMSESSTNIPIEVGVAHESSRTFQIPLSMVRVLREDTIPSEATTHAFPGFIPGNSMSIRSMVPVSPLTTQSHLFLKDSDAGLSIVKLEDNQPLMRVLLDGLMADQLLNAYALPDGTYQLIFNIQKPSELKPSFAIMELDPKFHLYSRVEMGTETTVLPETFKFLQRNGRFIPHFVSIGYTPKIDLPRFDPWKPNHRDEKKLRVYYLDQTGLRNIPLPDKLTPLFLLPENWILATSGNGYQQSYSLHKINDGHIIESKDLELPSYRMLTGLYETRPPVALNIEESVETFVAGRSSPGSLRISNLNPGPESVDTRLERPSLLDSLMSVIGVYRELGKTSYFAESHYDLIFYPGDQTKPLATTLRRYSYIPSMIFAKSIFPTAVHTKSGTALPGVYLPASVTNDSISEVWVADRAHKKISHPLGLRIKASGTCTASGNLVPGRNRVPPKMIFWCGNTRVDLPITIPE